MPKPKSVDLDLAIKSMVATEVASALAPYRNVLDRLSALLGGVQEAVADRKPPHRRARRSAKAKQLTRSVPGRSKPSGPGRGTRESAAEKSVPRPAASAPEEAKPAPVPAKVPGKADGAATALVAFTQGQVVGYRQGRGTFEAKVVGVDAERGQVTLERTSDGKKVVRPAAKVCAAPVSGPAKPVRKSKLSPKPEPAKIEAVKPVIRRKAEPAPEISAASADAKSASRFTEGQAVSFRKESAFVDAKVVGVDAATGVLTLEQNADMKRVEMPAGEVYTAA